VNRKERRGMRGAKLARTSASRARPERRASFRRILVPLDFTAKNGRAVAIAAGLALEPGAEVTLLHVVERIEGSPAELRRFHRSLVQRARSKMRPVAARLARSGVSAREEVVVGRRVPEILRAAADSGADLIVMSSHRVHLRDAGGDWGTISYQVGILAPCPVLLVK
jgi:nucleotide-binding universal stress UspA family protein